MKKFFYIIFFNLMLIIKSLLFSGLGYSETLIKSHGISSFGNLKYSKDFSHLEYVNPNAPKSGEISTWAFGTFDSLNRYIVKGNAAGSGNIFIETLMTETADEPDSMYGLLAESIEYPEDKSFAIFNLRPEAQFSDGSQVTASDVVFSHNILLEKGIPSLKQLFADIISVEALSPTKVKFSFKNSSDNNEMLMLAASSSVFSKKFFSSRDFAESSLEPMLGSGPYVLDEIEVGKRLVYKLNDNYWGKNLPINKGRNNFKKIRYEYYADTTAAFEGFKAGEYTFRSENSSQKWAQDYNFPAIDKGIIKKETLPDGNLGSAQAFFFNLRLEKFKDPKIREAIGLMFNFEWSNKTLFFGLYNRVTSFWENSAMQASGRISKEELAILNPLKKYLPESIFSDPVFIPPKSKPDKVDRKNRRKAIKLFKDAGWDLVDGNLKNKEGDIFSLEILNYSPAFDRIINPFIENLKLLGIEAKHTRIDSTQYTERVRNFEWEIITSTYGNSLTPGIELVQQYSSKTADVPSRNLVGLKNEGIDILINLAANATTRKELNEIIRSLDRSLRSLHIWVPQWYKKVHTVAYRNHYSYPKNLPPFDLGAFDFWWFDNEKAEILNNK
jgi:microcin C transport system substrate-binding protein